VLVVDDVAANRALVIDLLSMLDFEMFEAENGLDGIAVAQANFPDLIVMDNIMPVMTGLEAARALRTQPAFKQTPIIVASASATETDKLRSLATGADIFISKPIDVNKLVQYIGTLLNLTWLHNATEEELTSRNEISDLLSPPPQAEMETLYQLAMSGNMRNIRKHADYLQTLDERYRPFAEKLRQLAAEFQSEAIVNFVEKYLNTPAEK
jgi:CheY-like chemotaxis protein